MLRQAMLGFAVAVVLVVAPPSSADQADPQAVADFEDLDKTMTAFEAALNSADEKLLRSVSSESFERTPEFRRIREGLGRLTVNSASSSQLAEQSYTLSSGPGELVVTFRLIDGQWVVQSARIAGVKQPSINPIPLLAREYYFSDFRRLLEAGKVANIATDSINRLSDAKLKRVKLVPRAETTVVVTDLVLSDDGGVIDLIYVKVKKSDKVDRRSRGWLIEQSGSMLQYARDKGHYGPLLDFLSGNKAAFSSKRESAFVFGNVEASDAPALPVTHVDFRVERIITSGFKWEGKIVRFLLSVDCAGASWQPPYKVSLDGNQLRISTESDAKFVGTPPAHRYFNVSTRDGMLRIGVREDMPDRPVTSLAKASVIRHWTKPIEGGIRFVIELSAERNVEAK